MVQESVGIKTNVISCVYNIGLIFLFLNATRFINSKCKNKKAIGQYQRNIFTYKQNVIMMIGTIIFGLRLPFLNILIQYIAIDTRKFILMSNIAHEIFFSFCFPVYTLSTVSTNFPNFFQMKSKNRSQTKFFISNPRLEPRRYVFEMEAKIDNNNILRYAYLRNTTIIQIKDETKSRTRKKICDLPEIEASKLYLY